MKRFISLFLSILLIFSVIPLGGTLNVHAATTTLIVDKAAAANGTTVFNTVQDAINAVPANNTSATPYEIQIKNGTYIELVTLNKNWVTLTGESRDGVIVKSPLPDVLSINDAGYTIFGRAGTNFDPSTPQTAYDTSVAFSITTLVVSSSDCTIQNMTIKLDEFYRDLGPNAAVKTESAAQRNTFNYCNIEGGQDTLYENGRTYYYQCAISGHVDFMYGGGSSVFDSCDIKSIYWERLYNLSEVNGVISYGLSDSDRTNRGITADDIALWTATDPQRIKYPDIINGVNMRTQGSSTKPTDYAAPDFTRIITAGELNALTDAELTSRQIARDSANNPNNWKTIAEITASDSKRIKSIDSGYLTACSTGQNSLGFLYINCNLIGDPKLSAGSYALGRPWRPYSQTTYVNCKMGPHIDPRGWNNWGNTDNERTARYEEFGTMNLDGTPYNLSQRYTWAKILTDVEVLSRNTYNYLKGTDGWDPSNQAPYYTELDNIANSLPLNNIQFVSSNLDLPTMDSDSGASIQWLSSNSNLVSTTGVVNRPAYNAQNEDVTLTAAVTKDGRGILKVFNLTVLKASDSNSSDPDYLTCLDMYNALQTNVIPGLNLSAIKNDLTLPTTGINGTTLEWKSFNPAITDAGKITRPAATSADSTGILQVTIRKNQAAIAYDFDTTVIKYILPVEGMYTPEDFVGINVGNPASSGISSYKYDTNQFLVTGQGTGFTKTLTDNDQFYFCGVLMTGDFTISAKFSTPASGSPSIGLTVRDSMDPLSYHVTQGWTASKGRIMYRYPGSANGSTASTVISATTVYQQLTKKGDSITTIISATPITSSTNASTPNTVIFTRGGTGLGVDANGNQKEIYTGFISHGGAAATIEEVKIVTGDGVKVFLSSTPPPDAPENVVATPGDTIANMSWDTVTGATYYTVKQGTSAQGPFTEIGSVYNSEVGSVNGSVYGYVSGSKVLAEIRGLQNYTTNYFVVTASGENGESSPSEVVSVTPGLPKLETSDFVGLDIGSPTSAGSFSFDEDYNVFTVTGAGSGLAKTVAGPDQVYFMAVKILGDYSISGKLNFKYDPSIHANYTNMGVMIRESSDPASFEYSLQNQYGGKPVVRRAFRYLDSSGNIIANASNTAVASNEGCYFKMTKIGDDITVVRSIFPILEDLSEMVYTIPGVDGTPVTVSTVFPAKALGLGLDANGNPKESYAGFFVASVSPDKLVTCTFEDVKIVMSDGTVAYDSNEGKPIPPKNLVTKPYSESATITWDAQSTATSYTVYQSESAEGPFAPVTVADTVIDAEHNKVTAQVNGLTNDKTYFYRVTASNASGESLKSEMVSVTPGGWTELPPVITMTSAEPASEVFSAVLPLSGSVDKACTLTITHNGSLVRFNGDNTSLPLGVGGTFNQTLILKQGVNDIEMRFSDDYDLEVVKTYKITYTNKVVNINFYDTTGNVLTGLTPGKDILVKADVENYIGTTKDSVLVVGLYDEENNLVKFIYTAETISYGESEVFYAKFKLPDNVSGYTVKAFVWDNLTNMHPISDVAVLN